MYKDLNNILLNYKNRLHDVGIEITFGYKESEIITEENISMNTFTKVLALIEKNIFFTSKELEEAFRKIKDSYNKALYGFTADKLLGVYGEHEDVEEAELENTNYKFYKDNKNDILQFFSLIENEITTIKQDIGLI